MDIQHNATNSLSLEIGFERLIHRFQDNNRRVVVL